MQTTINRLEKISHSLNMAKKSIIACEETLPRIELKINNIEKTITMIGETKEYLQKAIDLIYERSVGDLNERLNVALKYIYDRDFSVSLTLEDKRGKSLSIVLKDEQGNEMSLKDSVGFGLLTIVSAVLHIYYLNARGSKVLMIDETWSKLSQGYLPRFFEFLKKMCEAMDFTIIIITHDMRMLEYCDERITVKNGEIFKDLS